MTGTKRGLAWLFAVLAVFSLMATACSSSSDKSTSSSGSTGGSGTTAASSTGGTTGDTGSDTGSTTQTLKTPTALLKSATSQINGAGSSFQDTWEQTVSGAFGTAVKAAGGSATVQYTKSGSSDGKKQLAAGSVNFAGSDSTIKPEEQASFNGATILYFPIVASPITMSYNLKGVTDLQLSADTIAKITMGQITTWDDPAIKADNPKATLPSTKITFVHRSDGSGTTSNYTKYLAAASPSIFTLTPGETVQWPAGEGGQSSTGVTTIIKQTDGAIGYVDLPDAAKENLDVAAVKNAAGNYVKPSPASASAAVGSADVKPDLTYNPINAKGADAYPITSPTFILVNAKQTDQGVADTLKAYLTYALNEGQSDANTTQLFYAKLPDSLRTKALAQVDQIKVG